MNFTAIIPARYASTRFPGKPLALLGNKPVIQHVYEQTSSVLSEVWVATDDDRIREAVKKFGGRVVMTRADHKSGTDRIEEAAEKTGTQADVIINIQGDEPFVQPSQIKTLMRLFDNADTQIGTLGKHFENIEAVNNPNSPKIVTDAYRREVLHEITQLPQSYLEIAESLEQLRWLENGYRIRVGLTDVETVGIDTPEDLQRAEEFLKSRS